jgi:hypothetical protein
MLPHLKIPFTVINWDKVDEHENQGEKGVVVAKIQEWKGLRVRIVNYSPGYLADHWCTKGHIVHCLEGSFVSELTSGERFFLSKGMSYVVSDDLSTHRSFSKEGVKLLIIDGDFLKWRNGKK